MLRRRLVALALALPLVLAACGGGDSGTSAGATTSARPTLATPSGTPFTVSFTGPELAEVGQTVTATLKNTGRLPDKYEFQTEPANAATITPLTVGLSPGQSVKVQIQVTVSPLIVNLQSISAGLGGTEASLSLGSNS